MSPLSSDFQNGSIGSVVGIRIGSLTFHLFYSPTDDACSLLRQLGISCTVEGSDVQPPRGFLLQALGTTDINTVKTFTGAAGEYFPDAILEIVDVKDPTMEVVDVRPDAVKYASVYVPGEGWRRP